MPTDRSRRQPSPELDHIVLEDLVAASDLLTLGEVSNADLRRFSPVLRRLLLDRDLLRVAAPRGLRILLQAPDNREWVRRARKHGILFFQSGGVEIFGVRFQTMLLQQGGRDLPPPPGFSPDARLSMKLDGFLAQPVLFFRGSAVSRADALRYVTNKAGGTHFDSDRAGAFEVLDQVRNVTKFAVGEDGTPTFAMDLDAVIAPRRDFELVRGRHVDPVLVELLATCQFLSQSSDVLQLRSRLVTDLGIAEEDGAALPRQVRAIRQASDLYRDPERQKERELRVCRGFLGALGIDFSEDELEVVADDPPDVVFRAACFEVKEVMDTDRRRGDEYREALERAEQATRLGELFEDCDPADADLEEVTGAVREIAQRLASRYEASFRRKLDLLVYFNREVLLRGIDECGEVGPIPETTAITSLGFRSVSVFGNSFAWVMSASGRAPAFLSQAIGQVHRCGTV